MIFGFDTLFLPEMSGLISSQIRITGNLEQDQQILLYGIAALTGLIVLSMIIIVIVVITRRRKRKKAAKAALEANASEAAQEPVEEVPVLTPEEKAPIAEEPQTITEEKPALIEAEVPNTSAYAPKFEEKAEEPTERKPVVENTQTHEEKLEEIRRRLDEIRKNKKDGPEIVLPKVEAAPTKEKPESDKEAQAENKEEIPTEDVIETVVSPSELPEKEEKTPTETPEEAPVEDKEPSAFEEETMEVEPTPAETPVSTTYTQPTTETNMPNGKFLPMKRMTFAEWVELFK